MKFNLVVLIGVLLSHSNDRLVNTVWAHKIANGCINTLTFKSNGRVLEYDCEMGYSFHSSYKLAKDTLIINGKDDSHSEDNGKITLFWINKYLIKNKALYVIRSQQLVNGKWKDWKNKPTAKPYYIRTK